MKHVFIINSHTTFLTAIGTVGFLKLSKEDVLFLYVRNYSNNLIKPDWEVLDISREWNDYPAPRIWRERKLRNNLISWHDGFVEDKIGCQYKFYSPHYGHPIFQLFYSNPLCIEGAYLQEGGIPFKNTYIVNPSFVERVKYWVFNNLVMRTKRVWMPHEWYYKGALNHQSEINSYGISDQFFKHLPSNNHLVSWPKVDTNIELKPNSTIFIFDGFVANNLVESSYYLNTCKRMISEDATQMNYLRFHPAQTNDEKNEICKMYEEKGLDYEVMECSIPFELILNSSKNRLRVTGLGSSLLFFARDLGHEVCCHDRWLENSAKYQNYKRVSGFLYYDEI